MATFKLFKKKVFYSASGPATDDFRLNSLIYVWKIEDIADKLRPEVPLVSDSFKVLGFKWKAKAEAEVRDDGYVYVSLTLTNTRKRRYFKLLNFVRTLPVPRVTYVLKDRTGSGSDLVRTRNNSLGHYLFYETPTYRMRVCERSTVLGAPYDVGGAVVVEVHVEPPSLMRQVFCADGSLTWKVAEYRKFKDLAERKLVLFQQSPYFYTGSKGHRVTVECRLNGSDEQEGRGVTMVVCFLTGSYDFAMTDAYRHSTELTLINQIDTSKSITKEVKGKLSHRKRYVIHVARHEDVEKQGFLLKDCLICKVNVKTGVFST